MEHHLEPAEKDYILETITSHFHKHAEDIVFVYLFGSFITERPFSDIDLGIFTSSELSSPLDYELGLESELERIVKYPVDVRVLNRAPLSFCYNVIRCGKLIVDRNRNLRAEFESRVLRAYFDFMPFRRRYLAEVQNAPL
jgi:hypothetical protein